MTYPSLAMSVRLAYVTVAIALISVTAASAQSAENVAVIVNEADESSRRIAEHYVRQRSIPASNVIRIQTSADETIDRAAYVSTIEQPIAAVLRRERLQDRILYVVLTKGIPLRIAGTTGQNGTVASVDSELTLLYRRLVGIPTVVQGRVQNPYFLGGRPVSDARRFSRRDHDIYLVSRLDAFTVDEALALIDRGKAAAADGRIVLDQRDALVNRTGEEWFESAAERLQAAGHGGRVLLETSSKAAKSDGTVLGYYSWGSTAPQNRTRTTGMQFAPGAVASLLVGTGARTFREPPQGWVPGDTLDRKTGQFAGSAESLIGDLIREGVSGVAGHVSEPFLQGAVRPEILFPAYVAGFNLIEAFYLSISDLSWQAVVVGDPLVAPFAMKPLSQSDIHPGLDGATGLPALFAARRVERVAAEQRGVPPAAVSLIVRAEGLFARGDTSGGRRALEQALQAAPNAVTAHLQLAMLDDRSGDTASAIEHYRRVIQWQPTSVVALNNLAYALAVGQNKPAEALPLARRAAARAPTDGTVLDTLGWIEHLMGNGAVAGKIMAEAVRRAPNHAEIRLHAAIVYAARGARAVTEIELEHALKLDPSLAESSEVRQLRQRLAELSR